MSVNVHEYGNGYGCGLHWARLKRNRRMAERLSDEVGGCDILVSVFQDDEEYSAAEQCYFTVNPRRHGDRNAAATFWSRLDSARPADDFVEGFCRGTFDRLDLAERRAILGTDNVLTVGAQQVAA